VENIGMKMEKKKKNLIKMNLKRNLRKLNVKKKVKKKKVLKKLNLMKMHLILKNSVQRKKHLNKHLLTTTLVCSKISLTITGNTSFDNIVQFHSPF